MSQYVQGVQKRNVRKDTHECFFRLS